MTSTLQPPTSGASVPDDAHRPSPTDVSVERGEPGSASTHTAAGRSELDNRYTAERGSVHLTGIQAIVRMIRDRAISDRAAGLNTSSYISGYEGSPLAGLDLELGRRRSLLEPFDIQFQPGLNEELGATAVAGSQLTSVGTLKDGVDGVVGYWYGKAPGLDRSADALRHANMSGASGHGGAVALVGDDPSAKSSTIPSNSSRLIADLGMPTLVPADSTEILHLGKHAAWMSRFSGLWTALRVTTPVADGSSTVILDGHEPAPDVVNDEHVPHAQLLGKKLMDMEASRVGSRLERALEYCREHNLNTLVNGSPDDVVGIICAGAAALETEQALRGLEVKDKVRILRLGMTWPLDPEEIGRFVDGLEHVVVVEEIGNFLLETVRTVLYDAPHRPTISHTARPLHELPEVFATHGVPHKEFIQPFSPTMLPLAVAPRVPHFCSGCPHNISTRATPDTVVGAGIGCHAMVMIMEPERVGNVVGTAQMGGEGAHWIGMSPFVTQKHMVQNMGDGTFMHSGSLAIRALVAAGAHVTVKLLHNGTVAMTGGQDPVGQQPLSGIVNIVKAENVAKIIVTSDDVARTRAELPGDIEVRDRRELAQVTDELAAIDGVTVLIHDQACATELRRARSRGKAPQATKKVVINPRICEGCGDCGDKSGCLSVQPVDTEFGRKTQIDQTTCNADYSCLEGDCPAFATVDIDPEDMKAARIARTAARNIPRLELSDLEPAPIPEFDEHDSWNVRVAGVGGTGVLTLAAVIATAAHYDGCFVRGNDMTGLAQKGGSVISDVRIAPVLKEEPGAVPDHSADLMLALDGLTAADPATKRVIDEHRTVAVCSETDSPTGRMVTDVHALRTNTRSLATALGQLAARSLSFDAAAVSATLFGQTTYQTMVMLGAAIQAGALPLTPESVERAIEANGRGVDVNIQAFRWGRRLVDAPDTVVELMDDTDNRFVTAPVEPSARALSTVQRAFAALNNDAELHRHVAVRYEELAEWGTDADAERFLNDLVHIAREEERVVPGSTALTQLASFGLHKLQAYKDEYEVARLATDPSYAAELKAQFGASAEPTLKLHPPMLRALGVDKKINLGPQFRPVLKGLAKMKRLRGTRLDVFGLGEVRSVERALIREYRAALLQLSTQMQDLSDHAYALEIAALADDVRGYEHIKLANAAPVRERLAEVLQTGGRRPRG